MEEIFGVWEIKVLGWNSTGLGIHPGPSDSLENL